MTADGGSGVAAQPTLEAVAARAGVSRATVSRVVNGSPNVSAAVRTSVERAVAELGYVPNRAARSLVTRRTDSVALLISESDARVFADPFLAGIVRSVGTALSETDLQLVLLFAQGSKQHERLARYVRNGHVDGVLLVSLHGDDPLPHTLVDVGIPVAMVGRPTRSVAISYVDADNRGGAEQAVRHLLGAGRTRIATITGPQDMSVGRDRLDGWRAALGAAGATVDPSLAQPGDFSEHSGAEAMRCLLERHPDLDAVFAASDLMAAGALRTLKAAGRRIPEDVAVVGFDDSAMALQTDPQLTTVRQPVSEMGRQSTGLLLAAIAGERSARPMILQTSLVVRHSA